MVVLLAVGPLPRAASALASVLAPYSNTALPCPMHLQAAHPATDGVAEVAPTGTHADHVTAVESPSGIPSSACDCATGCYLTAVGVSAAPLLKAERTRAPSPTEGQTLDGDTPGPLPRPPEGALR
jgi:hypothetical protein